MIVVSTEKFSGPLGLLLNLIEKEEMDITEISLAKIADEYVSHIRNTNEIEPDEMADFLLVAAKLLLIKSKALLPYLYTKEDEEEVADLERQLRMYKEFISASEKIKDVIAVKNFAFFPPFSKNRRRFMEKPIEVIDLKISPQTLKNIFVEFLKNLHKQAEEKLPEQKLEPKINIEDKIEIIRKTLLTKIRVNFSKILKKTKSRTEFIVSFLAVLELVKQKELDFEQVELFSEIHITKHPQDN